MNANPIFEPGVLYAKVWRAIRAVAIDAAPGSVTPETFARMATDIVVCELTKAGAIDPSPYP